MYFVLMNKLNTVDDVKIISFQKIKSNNTDIKIVNDLNKFFVIKRVFCINNNLKNDKRGFHAHKNCLQIVTCPVGSIKFKVFDGTNSKLFKISGNNKGIFIPNHIWTETTYVQKNTTLICYCSNLYNEKSYIRKKDEYMKFRKLI